MIILLKKIHLLNHANLEYLLQHNKNTWYMDNDPMLPNLEYWLETDATNGKKSFKRNNQSIPFSELYAFFGILILNYKIIAPNNDPSKVGIKFIYGGLSLLVESAPVKVRKRE